MLTKGVLSQSATRWAQGGVAAVLGGDEDSTDLHLADTLAAGAGLCDEEAVRILVDEGPGRVHELITLGVEFDREADGLAGPGPRGWALAAPGGARRRRGHRGRGGAGPGRRHLPDGRRRARGLVRPRPPGRGRPVRGGDRPAARRRPRPVEVRADHVVLATGGAGQLFSVTTNPPESTGDGVAMALRAGVPTADVEFVQFHPTALHHPAMPRPLLSEALRGHGALLRDADGERFVDELAPRDVVSRAMAARMAEQGADHLWLDATGLERFDQRFPTIAASLSSIGLDPETDWLPIAPAAHHLSGGVVTDLWGATALPGLWAVGEVACTGVHGANRLASNSLLEGMVFGARLAERIASAHHGPEASGALRAVLGDGRSTASAARGCPHAARRRPPDTSDARGRAPDVPKLRDALQRTMTARRRRGAQRRARWPAPAAVAEVADAPGRADGVGGSRRAGQPAAAGRRPAGVGPARTESRGAHARREFPETDPAWRRRLVHGAWRDRGERRADGDAGSYARPRSTRR